MLDTVWLIPLKNLDDDARAIQLGAVAGMELAEGQGEFVGDPFRMMLLGLEEEARLPYVIEAGGVGVGVLTLQAGAARLAGWPDDDSAWLLRGFLIDKKQQGRGLGTLAAAAAVEEARKLTLRLGGGQAGVVLSANERNPAGLVAYNNAGFADHGQYLGGGSGPQRIMYKAFGRGRSSTGDSHSESEEPPSENPPPQDAVHPGGLEPEDQPRPDTPTLSMPGGRGPAISTWISGIQVIIAIGALVATAFLTNRQIELAESTERINAEAREQLLRDKDRDVISGMTVSIDDKTVRIGNSGTETILRSWYWALAPDQPTGTMVEYHSELAPILACSDMTFGTTLVVGQAAGIEALFLVFQVPSGAWWSLSDVGYLEETDYRGSEASEAIESFRTHELMGDTVLEGYGGYEKRTIAQGTGPVPGADTYTAPNYGGVNAKVTKSKC